MKSNKAAKPEIDAAVKILLDLKNQFKIVTGQDWKPGMQIAESAAPSAAAPDGPEDAKRKRTTSASKSGGRRSRTSSRSESVCEPPEWAAIGDAMALNAQIIQQGDKIRCDPEGLKYYLCTAIFPRKSQHIQQEKLSSLPLKARNYFNYA